MVVSIRVHRTGGPECLQQDDVDVGAPARGELQLRQTAIGVNFVDCHHRSGLAALPALPHGLGSEAVGVVTAVGDGVAGVEVGQRVAYAGGVPPGAYAAARCVPAWRCVPVPDALEDGVVAATLLKGLTAECLVRRVFKVGPGHRVLVHAAAGGVGSLLCQWLRHVGATVFGVVSRATKVDAARANGCHQVLAADRDDVAAAVVAMTQGKGVDVVYDGVGAATLALSLQCLRKRGLLVVFGNASGRPEPLDFARLQQGSLFLTRPVLTDYTATRDELTRAAAVLFRLLQGGVLRPALAGELPLAAAAEAHRRLSSRTVCGSLVLRP